MLKNLLYLPSDPEKSLLSLDPTEMYTYVHQKERKYWKQPNHPLTIEWIGYCVFIQWDTPLQ